MHITESAPLRLPWTSNTIRTCLFVITGILVVLNAVSYFVGPLLPFATGKMISSRFLLDSEQNVPTWFASMLLLVCAALLAMMGARCRRAQLPFHRHWFFLALIFLGLSIDEASSFHELLIGPLRKRLDLGGPLYFAWVLPIGIACLALAAAYLPMILRLNSTLRNRLILAAMLYGSGALGMEMVGGVIAERVDATADSLDRGPLYFLITTIEEMLEFAGVIVLIHALIEDLRLGAPEVGAVQITPSQPLSPEYPGGSPLPSAARD